MDFLCFLTCFCDNPPVLVFVASSQDPEIIAMTNLVGSYQRSDINEFEKILKTNRCVL